MLYIITLRNHVQHSCTPCNAWNHSCWRHQLSDSNKWIVWQGNMTMPFLSLNRIVLICVIVWRRRRGVPIWRHPAIHTSSPDWGHPTGLIREAHIPSGRASRQVQTRETCSPTRPLPTRNTPSSSSTPSRCIPRERPGRAAPTWQRRGSRTPRCRSSWLLAWSWWPRASRPWRSWLRGVGRQPGRCRSDRHPVTSAGHHLGCRMEREVRMFLERLKLRSARGWPEHRRSEL